MKHVSIPSGASLSGLYRDMGLSYPKFFKMDPLSKLGFLLAEMLLDGEAGRFEPRDDRAVLAFSHAGSLADDSLFAATLDDFPSPALFVYTLPNTLTAEIAIRNKYLGETSAFVLESFNPEQIQAIVAQAFQDPATRSALVLWADCRSESDWTAEAWLINQEESWKI